MISIATSVSETVIAEWPLLPLAAADAAAPAVAATAAIPAAVPAPEAEPEAARLEPAAGTDRTAAALDAEDLDADLLEPDFAAPLAVLFDAALLDALDAADCFVFEADADFDADALVDEALAADDLAADAFVDEALADDDLLEAAFAAPDLAAADFEAPDFVAEDLVVEDLAADDFALDVPLLDPADLDAVDLALDALVPEDEAALFAPADFPDDDEAPAALAFARRLACLIHSSRSIRPWKFRK